MIPARNPDEVVESILECLEPHIQSEEIPSALLAAYPDPEPHTFRIRVGHARGARWYRLTDEEFDPTQTPPGVPTLLLP